MEIMIKKKSMSDIKQREIWVDNVKVIACVLVVLGHFFQSMIKANILPANDLYRWFNQTIYYFHVPLFFICSGYLYQRLSKVNDGQSWLRNIWKKVISLGVPYFTFSFATWILKTVFSSSTNDQIGGLFDTLFLHPTSPYWYLYALFFIFLITPTFGSKKMATAGLGIVSIFKVLEIIEGYGIQAISYILSNEIWFVIGMCLSVWNATTWLSNKKHVAIPAGIIFIALSVVVYKCDLQSESFGFAMGVFACFVVIVTVMCTFSVERLSVTYDFLAKYTMPIFLMHTLFAAPLRAVLLRLGVQDAVMHVTLGIAISFVGPIIASEVMKKANGWSSFFIRGSLF